MRKLKIFGILCLLSYCTAFIAFAASTIKQPQTRTSQESPISSVEQVALGDSDILSPPVEAVATASPLPATSSIPAPLGIDASVLTQSTPTENFPASAESSIDNSTLASLSAPLNIPVERAAPAISVTPTQSPTPGRPTTDPSFVTPDGLSPLDATAGEAVIIQAMPVPSADGLTDSALTKADPQSDLQQRSLSTPPSKVFSRPATNATPQVENFQPVTSDSSHVLSFLPVPCSTGLAEAVGLQTEKQASTLLQNNRGFLESQLVLPTSSKAPSRKIPSTTGQAHDPAHPQKGLPYRIKAHTVTHSMESLELLKTHHIVAPSGNGLSPNVRGVSLPSKNSVKTSDTLEMPKTVGVPSPMAPLEYLPTQATPRLTKARNTKNPLLSKHNNSPSSLPLPGYELARKRDNFPTLHQHSTPSELLEALQSLQSISITPGVSPLPLNQQDNVLGQPALSTKKSAMNTQPSAVHLTDKKKSFQLTNGLNVILQQDDRFPLVSLRLYVHAGSAYEKTHEAGISHVLEHMVFKGSRHYGDGEIAREVENRGGYLNAFTSFDQTGYIVDLPSSQWEKGLSVLKEMAFLPNFTAEHLASEKEVIVAELKRGKDSPGNVLFTHMIDTMFKGSTYAHPIIGFEETIRALTVEDLNNYHQHWYQPQAMTLVVCGNIDLEQAQRMVIKEFKEFANLHPLSDPQRQILPLANPVVNIQTGPWQKVRLTLAFHAPNLRDTNAVYLDLLTHMIGGDQTSPLFKKYKYDKRLVDSISMQNYSFEESGLVFVMATLDAKNIKAFWSELLADMQQGFTFTKEDLSRAQLALQDSFYRSRETLEGYASQIGHFNFYFKGDADAQNYLTTIANANLGVLYRTYNDFFQPQSAGIFGIIPNDFSFEESDTNQSLASWLTTELNLRWKGKAAPQAPIDNAASAPQEVIPLGNDCSLVLIPDKTLPYISASLLFDGGEALLTTEQQGLGALTAGVLTRGTAQRDYAAIQTFLSERAASLSASSNRQTFAISFSAPSQYTQDLFDLINEIVGQPSFLPDETDRVKENLQAAIIRAEEQPLSLAFRHLTSFLYPNHSYGFLQLGTPESIASFTHAEAQKQWIKQRRYPWTLSLCGDFSKEEILALAQKLPTPSQRMAPLAEPQLTNKKELILPLTDREQAHLFLVFPIPGTNSPDEASLELLTNVLAGQSGLLFSELRDKQGLGYSVTAFPWKTQKAGALIFYIGTEPESMEKAYTGFTQIIDFLKTTRLDTSQLERGKNILAGEYYRERQSLSARSAEGATFTALDLPLDFKLSLIKQSQTLNAKDIQKAAQQYLNLEASFIIKVLPKNSN